MTEAPVMPKIVLSVHATERMRERIHAPERKMQKIAEKAWKSTEPIGKTHRNKFTAYNTEHKSANDKTHRELRTLMGYTFVFAEQANGYLLITVI